MNQCYPLEENVVIMMEDKSTTCISNINTTTFNTTTTLSTPPSLQHHSTTQMASPKKPFKEEPPLLPFSSPKIKRSETLERQDLRTSTLLKPSSMSVLRVRVPSSLWECSSCWRRQSRPSTTSRNTNNTNNNNNNHSTTLLELNFMRLISLVGLAFSIVAILIIAIMTIYTFAITSFPVVYTLKLYGQSVQQYNEMVLSEYLMVYARDSSMIQVFNHSRRELQNTLNQLFRLMPESAKEAFGNNQSSNVDVESMKLWPLQDVVLYEVLNGNNSLNAVRAFQNSTHYNTLLEFLDNFNVFIRDLKNISTVQEQVIVSNSTSYLIVIVVCLVITLPIVIVIFVSAIRMERDSRNKLLKAKTIQVLNVLGESVVQRSLFRDWIQQQSMKNQLSSLVTYGGGESSGGANGANGANGGVKRLDLNVEQQQQQQQPYEQQQPYHQTSSVQHQQQEQHQQLLEDLHRIDLLEDIQIFKQPAKQELSMMRSLIEALRQCNTNTNTTTTTTSEDDSSNTNTTPTTLYPIEQDALSSLSYQSNDTFSVHSSVVLNSSAKNVMSQVISIYEKYLNPMAATHPVKCKGHSKIARFLQEGHVNQEIDRTLFDEIEQQVAQQLIPSFEMFQKTIPEGKDVEESSETLFRNGVLTQFRIDFRNYLNDFKKNYQRCK
ncbi:hypothetical protein FDP41_010370 [Naegleria fowleri]|uniref:RGS domain-containing protein n=1 Tax=Naegleria fowleri TaxID=5763 RepID=A0A6A5CD77_NAEFO|nr:uncharacterized protein FDP41_010370 [Naegleria fowleri]KAF0983305.1 hypothetical protein FDP41_010370 [Naegleria fowleri]